MAARKADFKTAGNRLRRNKGPLGHLYQANLRQTGLLESLRSHLPPASRPHCLHAVIKDAELVVFCDSPARASQLKYQCQPLLATPVGQGIRRVRVKVLPPNPVAPREKNERLMSSSAAHRLEQAANITTDTELAASLRRLAKHHR